MSINQGDDGGRTRISVPELSNRKGGQPIVSLTAYTTPMAKILDPHCDFLLVGDALGMVLYGMEATLGVSLEMMINHGCAVVRGSSYACVIVDMPFGTYQESSEQAYRNCARVMSETGCNAVKLEGGVEMAETVRFLAERGIPVMGHIGLKPQSFNTAGGFRMHGRDNSEAQRIKDDAQKISDSGAFSIVIEGVVEHLATEITKQISAVTIGIGASAQCDGQVLVTEDIIGMFGDFKPKFVKRYSETANEISEAVQKYAEEVKNRTFPADEHCYGS